MITWNSYYSLSHFALLVSPYHVVTFNGGQDAIIAREIESAAITEWPSSRRQI